MDIDVKTANYSDNEQAKEDIGFLLDDYPKDKMGGSQPLSEYVKKILANKLSKLPHAFSIICYVNNKPAGLVNCFEAFFTFKCQPLIKIHDVIVAAEYRGLGLSQRMLSRVEEMAKTKGCCKITLEDIEGIQGRSRLLQQVWFFCLRA